MARPVTSRQYKPSSRHTRPSPWRYAIAAVVIAAALAGFDALRPARVDAAVFTVVNTADAGPGSLRDAINATNLNPGPDVITFAIPGAGVHTISPLTPLPAISDPVLIDGTTEPGYVPGGPPLIEIDGSVAGPADGLQFLGPSSGSHVIALTINRFISSGITINGANGIGVAASYIGTDNTGTAPAGNGDGVVIVNANSTTIGGATPASRNVISGNGMGVRVLGTSSVTDVFNNYIGTTATGALPLGNLQDGVWVMNAQETFIGTAGAGNVISGNVAHGVEFEAAISGNFVQGNVIGLNAAGTAALPNGGNGVRVGPLAAGEQANNVEIGGASATAGNVISGNQQNGVLIDGQMGSATNNVVASNLIGTDAGGGAAIGNSLAGVLIFQAFGNVVGSALTAPGPNTIAGNGGAGVMLDGNAIGNTIVDNSIGNAAFGNAGDGVLVTGGSSNNQIGAPGGGANTIVLNGKNGVEVASGVTDGIRTNSILENALNGIVLGPGANSVPPEAEPLITNASSVTTVQGTLNSTPMTAFTIEVFDSPICGPGNGQGQTFLGSVGVVTNAVGFAMFNAVFPPTPVGSVITATSTDSINNTSPFSNCEAVAAAACPGDTSCNGYIDAQAVAVGNDPFAYCEIMRADVNMDGMVNILDLAAVAAHYRQNVPPAPQRDDQGPPPFDNVINILDLAKMAGVYNKMVRACPPSTPPQPNLNFVFNPCAYTAIVAGTSTTIHVGCTMWMTSPSAFFGWQAVLTQQAPAMIGPLAAPPLCTSTGSPWLPFMVAGNPGCGDSTFAFPWFPPTCRSIEFTLPGVQGPWPAIRMQIIGTGPFPTPIGAINVPPGVPPC